eukprot:3262034-Rhodomonas_salina.2
MCGTALASGAIMLRMCYAKSGTKLAYASAMQTASSTERAHFSAIILRMCYAMSGTELRICYAMSGTELARGTRLYRRWDGESPAHGTCFLPA